MHFTITVLHYPFNKFGKSRSKRRRQAVTMTPKDAPSLSRTTKIKTPKELDDSFVGESAERGAVRGVSSPLFLLNPASPQIYPNILNLSGTLAFFYVQHLWRHTLSLPLTMDQPLCSDSHLQNPLQYLNTQSSDINQPISIHSSTIQRQLLAQEAASPINTYQQT